MLTDLFWTIATSTVVLSIAGAIELAALVVGYFPLLKWFPIIGDYVRPAKLVAFLLAIVLGILVGYRIADEREEAKSLRLQLAAKTIDAQVTQASTEAKDKDLVKLKAIAADRQKRINSYAAERKARSNGACTITADDLRRRVPDRR